MIAFESGTVTQERFGERVRELGQKAASLRARRDDLVAQLAAADPAVPSPEAIGSVRANLAEAETAPKPLKKALAHTFVEQLKVRSGGYVKPTLKVYGSPPPLADPTGNAQSGARGGARTMTLSAVPTGFEPVSQP
ncbi:MAG: hypothetical protein QOI20_3208 [Acidimicrobiaceae bacterium]|nr:hypothetical protein [Acidimicrobiaceae bacterium]